MDFPTVHEYMNTKNVEYTAWNMRPENYGRPVQEFLKANPSPYPNPRLVRLPPDTTMRSRLISAGESRVAVRVESAATRNPN